MPSAQAQHAQAQRLASVAALSGITHYVCIKGMFSLRRPLLATACSPNQDGLIPSLESCALRWSCTGLELSLAGPSCWHQCCCSPAWDLRSWTKKMAAAAASASQGSKNVEDRQCGSPILQQLMMHEAFCQKIDQLEDGCSGRFCSLTEDSSLLNQCLVIAQSVPLSKKVHWLNM